MTDECFSEAVDGRCEPRPAYSPLVVVEPHWCLDSQPRLRLLGPALIREFEASLYPIPSIGGLELAKV